MPNPCQCIQDEIDNLEQEVSDLEDIVNELPITKRAGVLALIAALRRKIQLKKTQLQACLKDPSRYGVQLDGIEVTQSIEDMNNSVTLIANKTTVIRVYLSYCPSPGVTVRGELMLSAPSGSNLMIPSTNTVYLDPSLVGQLDTKRRHAQLSLNFLMPANQTAVGTHSVSLASVTDANMGNTLNISHLNAHETITFTAGAPLRVRILGMRYQYNNPPVTFIPSALDFGLINSWLLRAYPVAQVIISHAIVDANARPPFGCGDINAQVAAIRAQDVSAGTDRRTHYFGLVSDGGFFMRGCAAGIPLTPDPSTVASGPTGSASWGWDYDGSYGDWYTGHELGHTFGRFHPGSGCGESSDDPSYPFPRGQLANADDAYVGFDVGDPAHNLPMVAMPGTDWHDVMTYCNYQWLSSYTYEGIRTRLAAEDALPAGPALASSSGSGGAGRPDERFPDKISMEKSGATGLSLINIVATVNLTKGDGKIEYVTPLSQGEVSPTDPKSAVVLRFKRADGQVLNEYPVSVKLSSDRSPEEDRLGLTDANFAVGPDARIIELSVNGRTVDTFSASTTPPGVRNLRRVSSQHPDLVLAWETEAKTRGEHTYIVQVSTDYGRTWQTLAVGLTAPEVAIDRSQLKGAQNILVRVIATNGFTRSVVTSELLPGDT